MTSTFKQFLVEDDNVQQDPCDPKLMAQRIVRDCDSFLKTFDYDVDMAMKLFRGVKSVPSRPCFTREVRTQRKPTDTPPALQQYIDQSFKEKFGHPYRSQSAMATGERLAASNYGHLCRMFPIGSFGFVWSPVYSDMFVALRRIFWDEGLENDFHQPASLTTDNTPDGELQHDFEMLIDDFLESAYYTNQNLRRAIQSGHEIMINTQQYYVLAGDKYAGEVSEHLEQLLNNQGS